MLNHFLLVPMVLTTTSYCPHVVLKHGYSSAHAHMQAVGVAWCIAAAFDIYSCRHSALQSAVLSHGALGASPYILWRQLQLQAELVALLLHRRMQL